MRTQIDEGWAGHVRGGGSWATYVPVVTFSERMPKPHYSDARYDGGKTHTLYGREEKGIGYDYSDRLWQWDYAKMERAVAEARDKGGEGNSPRWWQDVLSAYFGKPIELIHVIGGVNVSSGYDVFGYRDATKP